MCFVSNYRETLGIKACWSEACAIKQISDAILSQTLCAWLDFVASTRECTIVFHRTPNNVAPATSARCCVAFFARQAIACTWLSAKAFNRTVDEVVFEVRQQVPVEEFVVLRGALWNDIFDTDERTRKNHGRAKADIVRATF